MRPHCALSASVILSLVIKNAFQFSEARKSIRETGKETVDFPLFMRIFAQQSGLMRYTAVKDAPFWIPGRDGIWIPVRPSFDLGGLSAQADEFFLFTGGRAIG